MSETTIITKIEELKALEQFMEELKAEAETLRDSLKEEMVRQNTDELEAGSYIVRFTSVLSTRFDTKRFKEAFGEDLYKAYTKQVASRRFSIA